MRTFNARFRFGHAALLTAAAGSVLPTRLRGSRRGVAAVLAMMFLVLFGSLSVAMAIASRGNITTAATHLHVMRAQGAAETGLAVAKSRLKEAAARFIISSSDVTQTFGQTLWSGDVDSLGTCTVLAAATGRTDAERPDNLLTALAQAHGLDQDITLELGVSEPTQGVAPADAPADCASADWLFTPAVAIESPAEGGDSTLCYSIKYAPLEDGVTIRAIVTGFDRGYTRGGQPIQRTIMEDFRMVKRVNHAVISPSRIMIGKNVIVTGDMGARYTDVNRPDGDPLVLKSDFRGISNVLDAKLSDFYTSLASDIDGDNRLRVGHPTEGAALPSGSRDYDGDGHPDEAFVDETGDGYVDEFDIFIKHFDRDGDHKVTLSSTLTAGTPASGRTAELVDASGNLLDEDLSALVDSTNPDRNRNGVWGFTDSNHNGRWDSGEVMLDFDSVNNTNADQILGFRDGFIDRKDQYAKVKGKLSFRTTKSAWEAAQGAVQPSKLQGPIAKGVSSSPVEYNVGDDRLPNVTGSLFSADQSNLQGLADGAAFNSQVATNLGVSVAALATYVESRAEGSAQARYLRLDADGNNDSLPDNYSTAYYEKMPYNSPSFSDWYYRPVYENMVFKDVVIPVGTNALFKNCTFVGVTYIRTTVANTHVLWGEYGKLAWDNTAARPMPSPSRWVYGDGGSETSYPTQLPSTACPPTQMILMANPVMDQADLPANQQGGVNGFTSLPLPLVISGTRVTDTKRFSNNIRFHGCLIVGSIVSESPTAFTQQRNKLQFTGSTRFSTQHPDSPDDASLNPDSADLSSILKSSLMMPNYSVDIGTFNSPTTQNVELQGAVIAGVLDVRGNASIDGALLLTYSPVYGQGPLRDAAGNAAGNPAAFNTTIGYFGPDDGDAESLDPSTLAVVNGQRIAGWDTNGDGLADVPGNQAQPSGSTAVPFHGYGRIQLRFNGAMTLPNGIMVPMQVDEVEGSYREHHQ
ncbi:MAG: hypothetical protein ACOYN0_01035 [Phycisphaerales bacterium]